MTKEIVEKPVNIEEVKAYLKIDFNEDDAILEKILNSCIIFAQKNISFDLCLFQVVLDVKNTSKFEVDKEFIPYKQIKVFDPSGFEANFTVENSVITIESAGDYKIQIVYGKNKAEITDDIKYAIMLHCGCVYENQEGVPPFSREVYGMYRKIKI